MSKYVMYCQYGSSFPTWTLNRKHYGYYTCIRPVAAYRHDNMKMSLEIQAVC